VYEFSVFLIVGDNHNFENENAFIVRTGWWWSAISFNIINQNYGRRYYTSSIMYISQSIFLAKVYL
jgi:hypothetical protein